MTWSEGPSETVPQEYKFWCCCSPILNVSAAPADLYRGFSCFTIWPFDESNLIASWFHLHHCRQCYGHLQILLKNLKALYWASGGSGSIWNHWGPQVSLTGAHGMVAFGLNLILHFADVSVLQSVAMVSNLPKWLVCLSGRIVIHVGGDHGPIDFIISTWNCCHPYVMLTDATGIYLGLMLNI